MEYKTALYLADTSLAALKDREGSMSRAEVITLVASLHLAAKSIAEHNAVVLPGGGAS